MREKVSLVINAFNEEGNIERTIKEALGDLKVLHLNFEIIVVDDGSQDKTRMIAEKLASQYRQIRVISHSKNRGVGAALKTGFRAAKHPLVFHIPGDGQCRVSDLKNFFGPIENCDVVVGYLPKREDSLIRKILSRGYNLLVRFLFGLKFKNINSVKLYRKSALDSVRIVSEGPFMDTEVLVRLKRAGARFSEVPISHRKRLTGQSKGANWQAIKKTVIELIKFLRER